MELNEILEEKLDDEQKARFQRDNNGFKLREKIGIIPVIFTIIGIYLESIAIVSISIICIIIFLIFYAYYSSIKKGAYEEIIIPAVLDEKIKNIEYLKEDTDIIERIDSSKIMPEYDRIKSNNYLKIKEDKYEVNFAKVITTKVEIEQNDDIKEKVLNENFSGIFAYTKLPFKFDCEFSAIENEKTDNIYKISNSDLQFIKMNNTQFDEQYRIYSMEQITIKKIFSLGVMARIIELNKKLNRIINFSVYNNFLFVKIDYENYLEFRGENKKYVNEELAKENLDILEQVEYFIRYFVNALEQKSDDGIKKNAI